MNNLHDIAVRATLNATYKSHRLTAQEYIATHPQVYQAFEKYTWEAINAGKTIIGAKMIGERIRWESFIQGYKGWKVNNTYITGMAQRFMLDNPQHQVFKTRTKKKEQTWA